MRALLVVSLFPVLASAATTSMMASPKHDPGMCNVLLEETHARFLDGSLATASQLKPVGEWIMKNLGSNRDNIELLAELNQILTAQKLPTIDTSVPDLKIRAAERHGIAFNTQVGVAISDGKHRFCFPCQITMNNFKWGIVPVTEK